MKETEQSKKTHLNKRALTSLFMFFSGFWLVPTGIVMHIVSQSQNELLHHIVMSMHNSASIIFVASVIVHLSLNWKSMSRYIAMKINEGAPFKTELIIAAVTVTGLILLIGSHALHSQ